MFLEGESLSTLSLVRIRIRFDPSTSCSVTGGSVTLESVLGVLLMGSLVRGGIILSLEPAHLNPITFPEVVLNWIMILRGNLYPS